MPRKYDINIEGEIGYWITGESVRAAMQPYAEREIKVRISSLGGALSDGLDICTLFRAHANVTAYLNGMVASAATIIAMGARRIVMAPEAVMLVHNASSFLFYFERVQKEDIDDKHEELKQLNEMLTTFDKVIAEIYSKRTGKSVEEMEKLMKEERWLTAEEALEYGLVDEIDNYEDTTTPETGMTAMVTAMCNAHGLPAPPLNIVSEPTIIERVLAKFGIGKAANKSTTENKCLIMDKTTHPDLLNALGVEKMEANEKGVMLSNAQAEMLNKALAEASKEKTRAEDLEKKVKELQSTIEAMKEDAKAVANADGAETGKVNDTAVNKGEDPVVKAAAVAKAQLEKIKGLL